MQFYGEDDVDESLIPAREDSYGWRKYQRDKSRNKRDRRRNLKSKDSGFNDE